MDARSDSWKKIKITRDTDCVILGYTQEKRQLTSLALGYYDSEGKLQFAGKVGSGFDEATMADLKKQLDGIAIQDPLVEMEKGVIPVEPMLVAQINYLEITRNNKLRAPVFVRLREDKEASECVLPRTDTV